MSLNLPNKPYHKLQCFRYTTLQNLPHSHRVTNAKDMLFPFVMVLEVGVYFAFIGNLA